MFVHRVAGPSRLSMPAKLAPPRSKKTIVLTNDGLGCFIMVQRHKSRMSQNPNASREPRRKKREVGDMEAMKKQGKQIAKMGKRGQEKKSIDASVFPTLDVELIEERKYPRQLYFPYMPRRLRDWPIFARFSLEDLLFYFPTRIPRIVRFFKEGRWRRILSVPRRAVHALNAARIATKEALSLAGPASSASLENHPSRSTPTAPSISAPGGADSPSEPDGPSLKMTLQTSIGPGKVLLPAAEAGSESDSTGVAIVGSADASLSGTPSPTTASRVSRPPTIFSKLYCRVFFALLFRQNPPPKRVRRTYKFLKPVYTAAHGFMKEHWTWWYLDPGYWSPQRRREAWAGIKSIRLGLWKDAANYIQESEKYGKDARECYMKKLENDRNNWSAMKLIAAYNRFPDYNFYKGLAVRNLELRWFNQKQRQQRSQENALFRDISSPKSLLAPILRSVKDFYVEMNEAIAAGRIDDLNQYAAKRYLNEIERRATSVRRRRENVSQTWKFERWVNDPECISLRAKDFFADYPGAYQGDHLVLNLLMKLDSWQSLVTVERLEGRKGRRRNRRAAKVVESRRVTEYIVVDFRTWIWEGKPRFIQEIYPGQKLDLITNQMTERKILQRLKKKEAEEREEFENEAGQGKAAALKPST